MTRTIIGLLVVGVCLISGAALASGFEQATSDQRLAAGAAMLGAYMIGYAIADCVRARG